MTILWLLAGPVVSCHLPITCAVDPSLCLAISEESQSLNSAAATATVVCAQKMPQSRLNGDVSDVNSRPVHLSAVELWPGFRPRRRFRVAREAGLRRL